MGEGAPFVVQAIYSFKGSNNDELAIEKGDVITITQIEEGGWWEGTLNGKTGWFPSNYVKECKKSDSLKCPVAKIPQEVLNKQKSYRNQVLQDLLESEKQHVNEITSFRESYLNPLLDDEVLSKNEFTQLVGNYDEISELHQEFLDNLESCGNKPLHEQRVGKLFLKYAPKFKTTHKEYCEKHPKAVCVLEKYKDELNGFIESKGGGSPGLLILTTGLSRPFRRLDKYPGILQELERQMEESHKDRGDTQRSVHVYNEICHACTMARRQKEMELEVLTGTIRGWEGDEPAQLGEILHMGLVSLGTDKKDRYLVLFPYTLVILSVSSRMSGFIFEDKLQLSDININKLDDKMLELTGLLIDPLIVLSANKEDNDFLFEILKKQIRSSKASVSHKSQSTQLYPQHNSLPIPPHGNQTSVRQPHASSLQLPGNNLKIPPLNQNKVWSLSSLQPAPPLRPCISSFKEDSKKNGKRFRNDQCHSDDATILQVIEAYCTSAKTRYTVSSALLDSPQVLIAEEEKIIVENDLGEQTIIEEKSLVDTVYALRDEMRSLKEKTDLLFQELEDEKFARIKFQKLMKSHVLTGRDEFGSEE